MADQRPKELTQAEELINLGKTEEALEIVRKFQQTAWLYFYSQKSDKALEIALNCKDIIEKFGKESDFANNFLLLGWVYFQKRESKSSLNYGMKSIDLHEKLNLRVGLASSYYLVGYNYFISNNFGLAMKYFKQALSINEINPREKAQILNWVNNIFFIKGNFSQSLKCSEEGLRLAKEENLPDQKAIFIMNKGLIYASMNDIDKAKDYFTQALELAEKLEINIIKGYILFQLILINVEENSMNQAKNYLERFREFIDLKKENIISNLFSVSRGIVLYQSSRTRDRAEAETLLKQIVDTGISQNINFYIYVYALYGLCFIYIEELRASNDLEIIEEINPLISFFFTKAEEWNSVLLLTLGKIYQAKVEVILMNIDKAKRLLMEAQQLAESSNIGFYAQIISNEHDRLLEPFFKKPTSERMRLVSLKGMANLTQREQTEDLIESIPEIPVFLLIITDSGVPLFSYSFSKELIFEDDIISGFISAFNTFSGELFSKGLDRARFGEFIILLESMNSFSVCYLFKGQSYLAKQKLTAFIEQLQVKPTIWQTLDKFFKTSQVAELKDLPQIENLIKDIFIT